MAYQPVPQFNSNPYSPFAYDLDENQRRERQIVNANTIARYGNGYYDANTHIYNEDDGPHSDARAWTSHGMLAPEMPIQSINNPTVMAFDTTKRQLDSYSSFNRVLFTFPEIKNIYSIRLLVLHYPLFSTITADQYFNFRLDCLPVINEAMAVNDVNYSTNSTKVDNVTLQAPLVESTPGSGFCLWKWEDSGQRPQIFTPRQSCSQVLMELLTKDGRPLDTGYAPGVAGDPVRFMLEFVHKK